MVSLPPRIPKPPKRSERWRSPAHCRFVRSHQCSITGCTGMPIQVAHVRLGSHAGTGRRPDDWRIVSLCAEHHQRQHSIGEATFWALQRIDVEELIEAFCKASPKAHEIARVRRERADG